MNVQAYKQIAIGCQSSLVTIETGHPKFPTKAVAISTWPK
jgi:hypothetical protein